MQLALFAPPTLNRREKARLARLQAQLKSAGEDLAAAESNLAEVRAHRWASDRGIINANWWDGALRFGIWDNGVRTDWRDGSYPRVVRARLADLVAQLRVDVQTTRAAVADLSAAIALLEVSK
jgi:hypothetical protein